MIRVQVDAELDEPVELIRRRRLPGLNERPSRLKVLRFFWVGNVLELKVPGSRLMGRDQVALRQDWVGVIGRLSTDFRVRMSSETDQVVAYLPQPFGSLSVGRLGELSVP